MPNYRPTASAADPWQAGYEAAIKDVLALLDEFDIRRSSLTAPLLLGLRANVDGLKAKESSRAA